MILPQAKVYGGTLSTYFYLIFMKNYQKEGENEEKPGFGQTQV